VSRHQAITVKDRDDQVMSGASGSQRLDNSYPAARRLWRQPTRSARRARAWQSRQAL